MLPVNWHDTFKALAFFAGLFSIMAIAEKLAGVPQ